MLTIMEKLAIAPKRPSCLRGIVGLSPAADEPFVQRACHVFVPHQVQTTRM